MKKKNKDGYVLKSEVLLIIQNYIRGIQMNDYGTDAGIPQLYSVMDQIDKMQTVELASKKYEVEIKIPAAEFERINKLLALESLERMSDSELVAAGAKTDAYEGVFFVDFADGSSLTFDLCSGTSNYYDNVVWTSADGRNELTLDCTYELNDIEFEYNNVQYFVRVVKE